MTAERRKRERGAVWQFIPEPETVDRFDTSKMSGLWPSGRNYELFGKLSGVREADVWLRSELRPAPDPTTESEAFHGDIDFHSHDCWDVDDLLQIEGMPDWFAWMPSMLRARFPKDEVRVLLSYDN